MVTCRNNVCNIDAYLLGHPKLCVATSENHKLKTSNKNDHPLRQHKIIFCGIKKKFATSQLGAYGCNTGRGQLGHRVAWRDGRGLVGGTAGVRAQGLRGDMVGGARR
jgi:hypothetical protein